jgi:hypothetical protein
MQLYSALGYCIGWIANNVPSPSASTPTPQPVGFHTPFPGTNDTWTKVVYAMALASDSNVAAQISLQLANNLRAPSMHPDVLRGETPPPWSGWTLLLVSIICGLSSLNCWERFYMSFRDYDNKGEEAQGVLVRKGLTFTRRVVDTVQIVTLAGGAVLVAIFAASRLGG